MIGQTRKQTKTQRFISNPKERAMAILHLQQISRQYKDGTKLYGLMKKYTELSRENPIKIRNPGDGDTIIHRYINNVNCNKTVICVFPNNPRWGFGDYLRGSISMAHYAKYFGVNFKMCMNTNPFGNYLNNIDENIPPSNKINNITYHDKYYEIYELFVQFMKSNENTLYISTNTMYNMKLPTQDIKDTINSFLTFKPEYYDMAEQLFNLKNYNVIHVRCSDDCFNTDLNNKKIITLTNEIKTLQLSSDTIVMSNNYSLKKILNKTFGFYFIDKKSVHTAMVTNSNELDSTIIEYIILSKSSHTYCFTYYAHGSGFSEQCSVLNNIPYQVTRVDI